MLRISERVAQIVENALEDRVGDDDDLEWDLGPAENQVAWYPYTEQSISIWVLLHEPDGVTIDTKITIPMLELTEERIRAEVNKIWDAFTVERLEVQIIR